MSFQFFKSQVSLKGRVVAECKISKHPLTKSEPSVTYILLFQISNRLCFSIWAIVMLSIVPGIEILHCAVFPRQGGLPFPFQKVPRCLLEIYRTMGYCFIGGLFTLVVTEMTKHQVSKYVTEGFKLRVRALEDVK